MKNTSLLNKNLTPPKKVGDIVEGKIAGIGSFGIFVDLGKFGSGIIYKRELSGKDNQNSVFNPQEDLKKFKVGDELSVKIIEPENEEGYFGLSINEAREEIAWDDLRKIKENNETVEIKVLKANKGGLISELSGIQGFLPLSQLSSEHYPRVEGGDKMKILQELQKLIGEKLEVKIFDLDPKQKKLIFSEKAKEIKKLKETLKNCKINQVIKGTITGVVDFGIFIRFSPPEQEESSKENEVDQLEGLIHISEIDSEEAKNIPENFKVGQEIKAKIINISDERIYLSLKNL
jgi:small subunit ribosomal protein S1